MKCPKCHSDNPDDTYYCGKCGTQLPPSEEIPVSRTETLQTPTRELTIGSTFAGRYQVTEELGKGGMGRVYKVFDKEIKEKVALKLLKPEIAADEDTIERFRNELKFSRKIIHKNVSRMYDLNKAEETYYITMEYVLGEDLKSTIRRVGQLSVGKAISIAKQVCEGLAEAHRLGVVHRDLKPQNIMIDREGNARIMDFGIARSLEAKGITDAGVIIGTPEYMSPEQVEGKEADQRSDIYSLGVILYEMVTGRVPFAGDTPLSIALKHKTEAPPDPGEVNAQIPDDLSRLILRCMEKDKGKRYQGAEELLSELSKIEKGVPTTDRILPEKKPEAELPRKRFKIFVFPGILLLAAIIIVAGYFLFSRIPQTRKPGVEKTSTPEWRNSVAVLPFADLSPQREQEYFCDGMTDAIIGKLSQLEELKVISRTSVMRYKDTDKDIKEIGQELQVATLLEGSIQRERDNIRVNAQLINVEDGFHLWSQTYDRKLESIFAIQDDISKAIAEALKIQLTERETEELHKVPTGSVEAYEFYLKGRSLFYNYEKSNNEQAITIFEKALELDSSFSLAYAGLSLCYSQYKNQGWDEDEKWLVLAESAANKAVEFDSNSAEAHFALGFVYEMRKAYHEMESEMLKVLELNPNHAHAHDSMADILQRTKGQLEDALREYNLALMIDPFLLPSYWGITDVKLKQGKYNDAKKILLRSLEIHENNDQSMTTLGGVYRLQGEYQRAVEVLKKAVMLNPSRIGAHVQLGLTYAMLNKYNEALAEADFISEIANIPKEENFSFLYLLGWISLEQGNWQSALENFEQALRASLSIPRGKEPRLGVHPEDIYNAIAETYLRQENFTAAIQEYVRMDNSPLGFWHIDEYMWAKKHYKLAKAYEKINDLASAKKEYETFLHLWKDADSGIAEVEDARRRVVELQQLH